MFSAFLPHASETGSGRTLLRPVAAYGNALRASKGKTLLPQRFVFASVLALRLTGVGRLQASIFPPGKYIGGTPFAAQREA